MSYPKTYHSWRRSTGPFPRRVVLSTDALPDKIGDHEVLIRIHAVALNYRDIAMLQEGAYPVPVEDGGISASDCAAEIIAVGSQVSSFAIGDHVAPTIDLLSLTGRERNSKTLPLGGEGPGLLREYAVFEEKVLVKLPKHLSWEEVGVSRFWVRSCADGSTGSDDYLRWHHSLGSVGLAEECQR